MSVLLIRHASAGDRDAWSDDDRRRPLDERGRKQAERLVSQVASYELTRILSSPADRCVQTVEPLAGARGVRVELREELAEEHQVTDGAALVRAEARESIAIGCHGGLSEALVGESQKKRETIVLEVQDDRLVVVDRVRA